MTSSFPWSAWLPAAPLPLAAPLLRLPAFPTIGRASLAGFGPFAHKLLHAALKDPKALKDVYTRAGAFSFYLPGLSPMTASADHKSAGRPTILRHGSLDSDPA